MGFSDKKKVFSCFGSKKGADTKVASALFFLKILITGEEDMLCCLSASRSVRCEQTKEFSDPKNEGGCAEDDEPVRE